MSSGIIQDQPQRHAVGTSPREDGSDRKNFSFFFLTCKGADTLKNDREDIKYEASGAIDMCALGLVHTRWLLWRKPYIGEILQMSGERYGVDASGDKTSRRFDF